jgi:serine/threonine protein phosphatase PrpC
MQSECTRCTVVTDQGSREYMEDRHVVLHHAGTSIAAVFDGHGGSELSEYCVKAFPYHLNKAVLEHHHDPAVAMQRAVQGVDDSARDNLGHVSAGSTLCAVLVLPRAIITANVGDSRAILSRVDEIVDLSRDHKPSDKLEQDRILAGGGFVTLPQQTDGVHRVMGRMSVSRALGDWELKPWVSSASDVTVHERTSQDRFIVVATDGVWDVMSSHEVCSLLNTAFASGMRPRAALLTVLAECRRRRSGDNITLVLVDIAKTPLTNRPL